MKLCHLILAVKVLMVSLKSFAVVQGAPLFDQATNQTSLTPFVALSFEIKGLSPEPCSASYLGEGKILTAAHCFLLNEYQTTNPTICIQDASFKMKTCLATGDYQVFFPPVLEPGFKAPTRKSHQVIVVPRPDLAVMVVKPGLVPKLPVFSTIELLKVSSSKFDITQDSLNLVGQGCTGYMIPPGELPQGTGVFRLGKVVLTAGDSAVVLTSLWTGLGSNAGVCWGDSGGPLMQGSVQVAVVSAIKTKHNPATGNPSVVTSIYTRLDHPVVQQWLNTPFVFASPSWGLFNRGFF